MADPIIDSAPTTSYSDPIYDRLEMLSQRVRRARWVIVAAIVVAVLLGLGLRAVLNRHPEAASAARFLKVQEEAAPEKRHAAYEALIADPETTPFFRAKAALELCQQALTAGKPDEAKGWSAKATAAAAQVTDADRGAQLSIAARLSEAAVAEDAGDLDAALGHYEKVQAAAASKFVTHYLLAVYGAARIEKAQGKAKAAIERLEPVITRSDEAAKPMMGLVQSLYWACKREVDGAPATTTVEKPADHSALLPANLPPVPTEAPAPAAPAAPATEVSAPAPAAPAPAPAAEAPAAPAAK